MWEGVKTMNSKRWGVSAADLDNDGWLDLILTSAPTRTTQSANTKCYVYFGGPDGFSPKHRAEIDGFTSLDAAVADD